MTCQWDRNWTASTTLMACDWVQCLKPPTPPLWSNLIVSNWDGAPFNFGAIVTYVCDRGFYYERVAAIKSFNYTCQNGIDPKYKRGFFNHPNETDWPRCVQGKKNCVNGKSNIFPIESQYFLNF